MSKQSARLKNKRRPGDPWISKNRVLNPTKSKRNCPIYRNPNFDTDETKLLIQLWGDPKVQRELITTHKKHVVIAQLSSKMEEYGYYRSPEEIMTRIKNMKCFYNRLKKEMELNDNLDPSWRHYADMDAIMTRPIFSVRPNEVPAPSLKYLMEQEEEKRRERKRKAKEDGIDVSDSDDDIDDVLALPAANRRERSEDECIVPDADIEFECDDITLAAIANGGLNKCDKADKETKEHNEEMAIKMEIESEEFQELDDHGNEVPAKTKEQIDRKKYDNELLIPKLEPIDVDDDDDDAQNVDAVKTTTSTAVSAPHLIDILSQPKKAQTVTASIAIANFSMAPCTTTMSASSSNSMIISPSTASKISVVSPTILMPQSGQLSTSDATNSTRPMRIGGNLQAFLTSTGTRQTMTAANGMKFILVNAGDQIRASNLAATTVPRAAAAPINSTAANVKVSANSQTSAKTPSPAQAARPSKSIQNTLYKSNILTSSPKKRSAELQPDKGDVLRRKELSGIKTSLMRLLKAREDGNELQSQLLAIERERLQYERTMSEKFLAIFEQNQKFQQQMLQQQQQILQIQQQQAQHRPVATTQQLFATATSGASSTMQNSGQLMMPPKLLITTMVPTSAASVTGAVNTTLSSKVLTTANFKNLNTNVTTVDKPLLIPKEEPLN